jgi:hypothetical protein
VGSLIPLSRRIHRAHHRSPLRDLIPRSNPTRVQRSNNRHTVESDATGPNKPGWSTSVAISLMHSAPSPIATAKSANTRPGSCTVCGVHNDPKRRRQPAGQRRAVGQIRQQSGAGMRHHPRPISSRRDLRTTRCSLHLESAFPFGDSGPLTSPESPTGKALSIIHTPNTARDLEEPGLTTST